MRVSLKAITLSSAILWGGAMLFVGLIHMAAPSYGGDFLRLMSSVYPGADTAPTLGRVLLAPYTGLWMAPSPASFSACYIAYSPAAPGLSRSRVHLTVVDNH